MFAFQVLYTFGIRCKIEFFRINVLVIYPADKLIGHVLLMLAQEGRAGAPELAVAPTVAGRDLVVLEVEALGVELGGVATFLGSGEKSDMSLFI